MVINREDLVVRSADGRDFDQLCLIEQGTGCRYQAAVFVRQMMTISPGTFFVVEENGRITGSLVGICRSDKPSEAWILRVRVIEGCRRQGIGSVLMNRIIRVYTDRKISDLWLTVSPANTAAVSFYQAHGFVIADDIERYFGEGERRYLMHRVIG